MRWTMIKASFILRFTTLTRKIHFCAFLLFAILVSGCMSPQMQSNRQDGKGRYTVKQADTLYSIAWRYGLDYKMLANWNQISDDYIIYLGQRLIMYNPGYGAVAGDSSNRSSEAGFGSSSTDQPTISATTSSIKVPVVKTPIATKPPSRWRWPVEGKLLNTFSIKQLNRRGIDIAGKLGQPVRATAAGRVVYSGNGLVGYGNLIIIKHNDTYLSAYAYCQERLVNEGTVVKAGAIIAKMGHHKSKLAKLHFEIRKNGKPVDPMKYLPNK